MFSIASSPLVGSWPIRWLAVVVVLSNAVVAVGQVIAPYPTTAPPAVVAAPAPAPPSWGGYVVADPVPFQPTIDPSCQVDPSCQMDPHAPVITVAPPPSEPWQIQPVASPDNTAIVTIPPPGDVGFPQPSVSPSGMKPWFPPGGRQTFFQKVRFTGAYLPRFGEDSLGMSDLQLDVGFALPFFTVQTPLLITPFYAVHFMDGPATPDVPPRLHDAAVTFQNIRPLNDHWLVMADVTLGQYAADAAFDSSEAFRITGSGAGVYRSSDRWKWVLGASYVNRASTQILPVAGFVYSPNDDNEYNLVFPVPKISHRLVNWSDNPGTDDRWIYLGGEFGGGAWAVNRADGTPDRLDITDWRVFLGLERRIVGGLSRRVEVGYVFQRKMEYQSNGQEIGLGDTLMLRGGLTY